MCENNLIYNFYFNTTFWNVQGVKVSEEYELWSKNLCIHVVEEKLCMCKFSRYGRKYSTIL